MSNQQFIFSSEDCSISEFLRCVSENCETLEKSQFGILDYFKKRLLSLKQNVDSCLSKVLKHEKEIFASKVACSNENNIVIHGLMHKDLDIPEKQKDFVNSFFLSVLGVSVIILSVSVKKSKNFGNVIIVSLPHKRDKGKIFSKCHLLKYYEQKISITDDNKRSVGSCSSNDDANSEPAKDHVKEALQSIVLPGQTETVSQEYSVTPTGHLSPCGQESSPCQEIQSQELRSSLGNELPKSSSLPLKREIDWNEKFEEQFKKILSESTDIVFTKSNKDNAQSRDTDPNITTPPDMSHTASLWNLKSLKKKRKQLMKFAKKECSLSEDDVCAIFNVHGNYNRTLMKKRNCICGTFHVLPKREVEKELVLQIQDNYIRKHANILLSAKKAWEENLRNDSHQCFCKFMIKN